MSKVCFGGENLKEDRDPLRFKGIDKDPAVVAIGEKIKKLDKQTSEIYDRKNRLYDEQRKLKSKLIKDKIISAGWIPGATMLGKSIFSPNKVRFVIESVCVEDWGDYIILWGFEINDKGRVASKTKKYSPRDYVFSVEKAAQVKEIR